MRSNHLSYKFHPNRRAGSPGYPGLEIVLRDSNKAGPHDLKQAKLWVGKSEGAAEMVTLSHSCCFTKQHICVGNIALQLWTDERVVAFTFGGDLQVQQHKDKTLISLTSSAPILLLNKFNRISTILANEAAILIAEIRAEELPDLSVYINKITCIDPLELYCACLKSLKVKFTQSFRPITPSLVTFSRFLTTEIDSLHVANLWPNRVTDLFELFGLRNGDTVEKNINL